LLVKYCKLKSDERRAKMPDENDRLKDKFTQHFYHPRYRENWANLKEEVDTFSNVTRRSFAASVMYLIEKGLEASKDEYRSDNE
jgi:hypothetical protein